MMDGWTMTPKPSVYYLISQLLYLVHCRMWPDERCLSHGMCLYQVMMTLQFLNDVAKDTDQNKNRKLRHNRSFEVKNNG